MAQASPGPDHAFLEVEVRVESIPFYAKKLVRDLCSSRFRKPGFGRAMYLAGHLGTLWALSLQLQTRVLLLSYVCDTFNKKKKTTRFCFVLSLKKKALVLGIVLDSYSSFKTLPSLPCPTQVNSPSIIKHNVGPTHCIQNNVLSIN